MDELYIFHASKNKNLTNSLPAFELLTQIVVNKKSPTFVEDFCCGS